MGCPKKPIIDQVSSFQVLFSTEACNMHQVITRTNKQTNKQTNMATWKVDQVDKVNCRA